MIGLILPVLLFSQEVQPPKIEANIEEIAKTSQLFKFNTIQQRLKSISVDYYFGGVWSFTDSIKYTYSGTHDEGEFSFVDIEGFYLLPDYDNLTWLDFDGVLWANYIRCTQTFDVNGYK
jgi:hypothetical protein